VDGDGDEDVSEDAMENLAIFGEAEARCCHCVTAVRHILTAS